MLELELLTKRANSYVSECGPGYCSPVEDCNPDEDTDSECLPDHYNCMPEYRR